MTSPIRPNRLNEYLILENRKTDFFTAIENALNPETLSEAFFQEVQENLKNDYEKIVDTFFIKKDLGSIENLEISIAGKERHYGGKVALYITFYDSNGNFSKVVYKPRSLAPEIHLENFLKDLNKKEPRPILNCEQYGYDGFIVGEHLCQRGENLEVQLVELLSEENAKKENINLIYTLARFGFEDTHQDNFLIDEKGYLYFIDAEIFCTKSSKNLNSLMEGVEKKIEKQKKDIVDSLANKFIKELKSIPTRLIFCGTDKYQNLILLDEDEWRAWKMFNPITKVGNFRLNTPDNVYDYHILLFSNFLIKNKILELDEKDNPSIEMIRDKINNLFEEENATEKINFELQRSKELTNPPQVIEIPVFHLHLEENWIRCSHSGAIKMKRG
ncbi:MAG: DUF4135 domain-containing protein [Candidatus Algichlamydia australiensis]|nr:DUF4135 domain-containing protein [Chlamydiales bacterium]